MVKLKLPFLPVSIFLAVITLLAVLETNDAFSLSSPIVSSLYKYKYKYKDKNKNKSKSPLKDETFHLNLSSSSSPSSSSSSFPPFVVYLMGVSQDDPDLEMMKRSLLNRGFGTVQIIGMTGNSDDLLYSENSFVYKYQKATGLMTLVSKPKPPQQQQPQNKEQYNQQLQQQFIDNVPKYIPLVTDMETVLIANGWSFLDPDESEPMSAYDIDAANLEGQYKPKWGQPNTNTNENTNTNVPVISSLGFDLTILTQEQIQELATTAIQNDRTRACLLEGATDPPNIKRTHNHFDFSGPAGQSDIPRGIFTSPISGSDGNLPLFSSFDLAPTTASSGWLSFSKPIAPDHVILVYPDNDSEQQQQQQSDTTAATATATATAAVVDRRIEVLCAKSKCHLGHYFGKGEGYCINASCLNFIPDDDDNDNDNDTNPNRQQQQIQGLSSLFLTKISTPFSWRPLDQHVTMTTSSSLSSRTHQQLKNRLLSTVSSKTIVLGAGCFWHVEAALRRLPGVIDTTVGYAGGNNNNNNNNIITILNHPTYEQVCNGDTGHAEVVRVMYDPTVLPSRMLLECFLAMHDPTKVRAHGKHAMGTGQYRSCIFTTDLDIYELAINVLKDCQEQLQKEISTQVHLMEDDSNDNDNDATTAATAATVGIDQDMSSLLLSKTWFWPAEDRHQRHDEKRRLEKNVGVQPSETETLHFVEWMERYGRRAESIMGSSETINLSLGR